MASIVGNCYLDLKNERISFFVSSVCSLKFMPNVLNLIQQEISCCYDFPTVEKIP